MAEKTLNNQSIEKLFQIIEVMADAGKPMRLNDISAACSVSPSTALRILNTIIGCGYALQNAETQMYSLSFRFLEIGNLLRVNTSLNQIMHPYLEEITRRTGICSALSICTTDGVVYVDEVSPSARVNMVQVNHYLGHAFPLNQTASGKIFLSRGSREEVQRYLSQHPLASATPNTITDRRLFEKELDKVREQGFALNNEESSFGLRCISIPVCTSSDALVASISISGTIYQISTESMPLLINLMKEIAERIRTESGGVLEALGLAYQLV